MSLNKLPQCASITTRVKAFQKPTNRYLFHVFMLHFRQIVLARELLRVGRPQADKRPSASIWGPHLRPVLTSGPFSADI